ncbi:hypothetical protein BCR44DRAFT_331309 [Catenaria anguillulae PL171]|uniref:Uncharacterized protein n=1 Tax=Catenaria anguillulae PL171 TaxID=765915 RepID=A0A1Y2HN82_9FUNG|nr:hypothetical protein BCR44DRAFT_331309 [Catenaria anguillulae PL171]
MQARGPTSSFEHDYALVDVAETWFRILTKELGDQQELGLLARFALAAFIANSLRLADVCHCYQISCTLPYRHPLTKQPTCDPQVLGANGIDLVHSEVHLLPVLCMKPSGLSESHMDNMTSAFRHVLRQTGHHDKLYVDEQMPEGTLKVSGNPFNATAFKTFTKHISRAWRKFGQTTLHARTISVYQLQDMYNAICDLANHAGMAILTGRGTRRTAIQRATRCNATAVDIREIADHKDQMTLATYTLDARAGGQAERLKYHMDIDPWLLEWPFRPVRRKRLAGEAILTTKEAHRHEHVLQAAFSDLPVFLEIARFSRSLACSSFLTIEYQSLPLHWHMASFDTDTLRNARYSTIALLESAKVAMF